MAKGRRVGACGATVGPPGTRRVASRASSTSSSTRSARSRPCVRARLLAGLPPAAIVSSDLVRARATAERLLRLTGLEVRRTTRGSARRTAAPGRGSPAGRCGRWTRRATAWRHGSRTSRPAATARARSEVAERASRRSSAGARGPRRGRHPRGRHARWYGARDDRHASSGSRWSTGTSSAAWPTAAWSVLEETAGRLAGGSAEHNAGTLPEPVVGDDV